MLIGQWTHHLAERLFLPRIPPEWMHVLTTRELR